MKSFIFGQSQLGLPILAHQFGYRGPKVLILGGVHGDEWEGVFAAKALIKEFLQDFSYRLQITLIPEFNVEGVLRGSRKNSNNVDLNRNLPTNDWTDKVDEPRYFPGTHACSEPENQALVDFLTEHKQKLILSLHSWKPLINTNGNCNPEAGLLSSLTGYVIKESIGYPTPGCLGTYTGIERDMPTITYEIERDIAPDKIIKVHIPAIKEALKLTEKHR